MISEQILPAKMTKNWIFLWGDLMPSFFNYNQLQETTLNSKILHVSKLVLSIS